MPLQIQLAILFAGLCFQYSTWSLRDWRTEQPPDPPQVSYGPQLTLFSTAEYHAAAVISSLLPQLFLVSISNIHKSLILRYRDSQTLFCPLLTTFLCIGGTCGLAQHHLSCASVTSKAGESEDPPSWRWFIACHPELLCLPISPSPPKVSFMTIHYLYCGSTEIPANSHVVLQVLSKLKEAGMHSQSKQNNSNPLSFSFFTLHFPSCMSIMGSVGETAE